MHGQPSGPPAERAAWWSWAVSRRLELEPALRAQIPDGAFLCVLPDDDPEVARLNLLETEQHEDVALLVVTGSPEAFEVIVVSDDLFGDPFQDDLLFGDAPPKPS